MLSVSRTMYKQISLFVFLGLGILTTAQAQTENSPYSRYGLGDDLPSQNILSRAMGGVSAAYFDFQSVNFINPASYSKLKITTFDFGAEVDSRTIRALNPPRKFNSVSPTISYIQLGFPLSQKRNWGMNFGLRPMTRINYNIDRNSRISEVDSVNSNFQGNGGAYQVYAGTGVGIGNLSVGINVGYLFGSKDYSTRTTFLPDSLATFYYRANHETRTNYGGLMLNAGLQYSAKLGNRLVLQLGGYGNLKQELNATRDIGRETFTTTETGDLQIDSVFQQNDIKGKLEYPMSYGFGFMLNQTDKWSFGADYSTAKWSQYKLFGESDLVQDSWKLHVGGQIVPNIINPKSYWGRVAYRAGFNIGKDYVNVNEELPVYNISFGLGLPMRRPTYTYQSTVINTTFEFGQRGSKESIIRENTFRISFGLTLSDLWFVKRKYE